MAFGPPHLTLKPSKKTRKSNKKQENKKRKKKKKKENKKKTKKNTKIPKRAYQLSVKCFFCFWWVSKISLSWQLGQKSAHPKNTIKQGFKQGIFWKTDMRHETTIFWQKKNPNPGISVIFFLPFSSLSTTKDTRISWNPYFYSDFSKPKKENFRNLNLKNRKSKTKKNKFCTLFLKKAIFRKLSGHQEKNNNNWAKAIVWNPYFYIARMTLAQLTTLTWPS